MFPRVGQGRHFLRAAPSEPIIGISAEAIRIEETMVHKARLLKILQFPLTRILVGFAFCALSIFAAFSFMGDLLNAASLAQPLGDFIAGAVAILAAILSYIFLFRYYESREIVEFKIESAAKYLSLGVALGLVLQSLTVFIIYLGGAYSVESFNAVSLLLPALTMALTSAVFEEVLFRGVVFRIVEESLGSYAALGISAAIFGAVHLVSPNSTVALAISLAVQAGLLLGVAYIWARNLWFPIAVHFAWNFAQSGLFGANTSGVALSQTLVSAQIQGPDWLTGGEFGPEGSLQATIFCLLASAALLWLSHKKGSLKTWAGARAARSSKGAISG